MSTISSKTRSIFLLILFILFLSPHSAYAQMSEHTITITENQQWGQIIIEADTNEFEADIITPDGTTWSHKADNDPDVLFYFAEGNYRHWVAEGLKSGTYKVLIEGPADANYTIRNQNSYEQASLTLASPAKGQYTIDAANPTLEATWQHTGDLLRSNELYFWLEPIEVGEPFLLKSSFISSKEAALSFSKDIVDGQYKLMVSYDNNTSTAVKIDPDVMINLKRGQASQPIDIFKLEPAGHGAYAEIKLPQHNRNDIVEVAFINDSLQKPYKWQAFTLSQLEVVERPEGIENSDIYRNRYGLFIPYEQAGTFKAAFRMKNTNGNPGTVFISEQQVTLQPKNWPENMFAWFVDDGLTNVQLAQLEVNSAEASHIMITLNGQTILDEKMDSTKPLTTYELQLAEGEQTYVVYAYDELGNYVSDGRIYQVDHTSARLEMIGPLPSHTTIPDQLVSGWTEPGVTLTINGEHIEVDETGYFSLRTKTKVVDIIVKEASGNETVYHWEATGASDFPWWIIIVAVVLAGAGVIIFLFVKKKNKPNEETR